jgi:hypothetical protein
MASLNDELALRAALDDLATGQPEAPVERLSSIRGRHVRRRRAQGIAAGIVTAAVVVGALFGAGAIGRTNAVEPAQHRHLPSWALPWPDHRDPTTSDVLRQQAVAAWLANKDDNNTTTPSGPLHRVIWYLTAPIFGGTKVAVVFEVETLMGEHKLVAGYLNDRSGASKAGSWDLIDAPAPSPVGEPIGPERVQAPVVSFYADADLASGSNGVVLLTSPEAHQVYFGGGGGMHPLVHGFATAVVTHVRSRVQVAVEAADGTVLNGGFVGLVGNAQSQVPRLEHVPDLATQPAESKTLGGSVSGQGAFIDSSSDVLPIQGTRIYARCYGGRSLQVWIDSDIRGQRVTVPCDDREHVLLGPRLLASGLDVQFEGEAGTQTHGFGVNAPDLVAYQVAVGLLGR